MHFLSPGKPFCNSCGLPRKAHRLKKHTRSWYLLADIIWERDFETGEEENEELKTMFMDGFQAAYEPPDPNGD